MENILINLFGKSSQSLGIEHFITIGIVLVAVIAACIALSVAHKRLRSRFPIGNDIRKKHLYTTVFRIIRIAVILAGAVVILQTLGINTSWFTITISVIALMITFAVKDSFQDIFAGITIMFDKYYSVGDAVELEGKEGIVISFTIRTTKIECLDDRSVLSVANRNISKIRKLTHMVDIDLPLSYEENTKHVYTSLEAICEQIARIDGVESCQFKGTQSFSDSAVIYKIRFFCEPHDRPDIRRAALKTIQNGLEEAKLQIPYQQIDIHQR